MKASKESDQPTWVSEALSCREACTDLRGYALFSAHGLDLYLIPGELFPQFANAVGILREFTYRDQLSGSGNTHDLDSRDEYYDHFLLVEKSSGEIAGSARLQFVPKQRVKDADRISFIPQGHQSYLEHVYPGIKDMLARSGNHLEIGRVALSPRFQRLPHTLMCLFRGGLQVAISSGYTSIYGLVSYNHFAYSDAVNNTFLGSLTLEPFGDNNPSLPHPRHPMNAIKKGGIAEQPNTIQALEKQIQTKLDPGFKLPVLLRQYISLIGARVQGLSLAVDFNQITEILMSADLSRMPANRLEYFTGFHHQDIYKRFNWYRGLDAM